jgi:hypothetical protein
MMDKRPRKCLYFEKMLQIMAFAFVFSGLTLMPLPEGSDMSALAAGSGGLVNWFNMHGL